MKYLLICFIYITSLTAQTEKWGWDTHRYINENAVDYLPSEMAFFQDHRYYLKQHAVDPDMDPLPGYYHYIDIDYYPEFFTGTLPHKWDDIIAMYGLNVVQSNGVIPWVIEWWTDSLSVLMASGQWNDAWQVAAELGHYVADSHQPLHLTLNYNGQLTGNYGIHSRYETQMINPHLSTLPFPTGFAEYWSTPIDSIFLYIEEIYPCVDSIMIADDLAKAQDPNYGNIYYSLLWQELEILTTKSIHKAIIDLASLWKTAWVNAGSPNPVSNISIEQIPNDYVFARAYPNPFNPEVTIEINLIQPANIDIQIYNLNGRKVSNLHSGFFSSGTHQINWNINSNPGIIISSGTYFVKINSELRSKELKLLVIK